VHRIKNLVGTGYFSGLSPGSSGIPLYDCAEYIAYRDLVTAGETAATLRNKYGQSIKVELAWTEADVEPHVPSVHSEYALNLQNAEDRYSRAESELNDFRQGVDHAFDGVEEPDVRMALLRSMNDSDAKVIEKQQADYLVEHARANELSLRVDELAGCLLFYKNANDQDRFVDRASTVATDACRAMEKVIHN
jgi:hypothetical protein